MLQTMSDVFVSAPVTSPAPVPTVTGAELGRHHRTGDVTSAELGRHHRFRGHLWRSPHPSLCGPVTKVVQWTYGTVHLQL